MAPSLRAKWRRNSVCQPRWSEHWLFSCRFCITGFPVDELPLCMLNWSEISLSAHKWRSAFSWLFNSEASICSCDSDVIGRTMITKQSERVPNMLFNHLPIPFINKWWLIDRITACHCILDNVWRVNQFLIDCVLTLKTLNKCVADDILFCSSYYHFWEKIKRGISCESSARQMIYMKYQALFSRKNNKTKKKSSAWFVISALRVNEVCAIRAMTPPQHTLPTQPPRIPPHTRKIYPYFTIV